MDMDETQERRRRRWRQANAHVLDTSLFNQGNSALKGKIHVFIRDQHGAGTKGQQGSACTERRRLSQPLLETCGGHCTRSSFDLLWPGINTVEHGPQAFGKSQAATKQRTISGDQQRPARHGRPGLKKLAQREPVPAVAAKKLCGQTGSRKGLTPGMKDAQDVSKPLMFLW
jgi:hypothetical protein